MGFIAGLKWFFSEDDDGRLVPKGAPLAIVAYGDSTTYGDELPALYGSDWGQYRWTDRLGKNLSLPIVNCGMNGHSTARIAARAGAVRIHASVVGGIIPAYGPVILGDLSIPDPLVLSSTQRPYPLFIELTAGDGPPIRGRLQRIDRATYSFNRSKAGVAKHAERVSFVSFTGREHMEYFAIIGAGTNDEPGPNGPALTTEQMNSVKSYYRAMVSGARAGYICWGPPDRGYKERAGTFKGDFIREMENWLRAEFGANFVDVRGYLSSAQALADAAILQPGFVPAVSDDPQFDDAASIAAGTIPPSFRFSGVHFNALGHALVAHLFATHLRQRFGYKR